MVSRRESGVEAEAYLDELRGHLRGLSRTEVDEILTELRSHISDKLAKATSDANETGTILRRLGPPAELALQYRANQALSRARPSPTPSRVLAATFEWTRLTLRGAWIVGLALVGYFACGSFVAAAVLKPFHPGRTGLWRSLDGESYSLRLGLGATANSGEELLGWWIIPVGLTLGALALFGVTPYARAALERATQDFREALPRVEN